MSVSCLGYPGLRLWVQLMSLCQITKGIGSEVRDSTKFLDGMVRAPHLTSCLARVGLSLVVVPQNDTFGETSGLLGGTFQRMSSMAKKQGSRWWYCPSRLFSNVLQKRLLADRDAQGCCLSLWSFGFSCAFIADFSGYGRGLTLACNPAFDGSASSRLHPLHFVLA